MFLMCLMFYAYSYAQNDCPPTTVCAPFAATPSGAGVGGQFGEIGAATDGCLSGEHNSTWITVTILTSGTLEFTINPNVNANDFDFAVWGPGSPCPPTVAPIRCSFAVNNNNFVGAGDNGNTGVNTNINFTHPLASETDLTEGVFGNGWVNAINVTAGQTYLILVDNFTTNSGFNITFGGTATLDCTALPIELLTFYGTNEDSYNLLTWSTATETNNDYFILERSSDGYNWTEVSRIDGAGNSSQTLNYSFKDFGFKNGINYYRLTQTDYNGQHETFNIIAINNYKESPKILKTTNMMGQEVSNDFEGLRIVYYSDGTTLKRVGR